MGGMEREITGSLLTKEMLGQGAFGQVYRAIDLKTNHSVAVKWEAKNTQHPQLAREAQILSVLQGPGIPRIHALSETETHRYLVEELLSLSLAEYSKTLAGVTQRVEVIQQCIDRLEFIHSHGFLHNDVKPENFCLGADGHTVYLIDFGLASRFREGADEHHIDYRENVSFCGTAVYASLRTHMGVCPSRRDDLESVLLMAVRLFRGKLPWEHLGVRNSQRKHVATREMKLRISVEELCTGLPPQLRHALKYVRGLTFTQDPDYALLRSLLEEIKAQAESTPTLINSGNSLIDIRRLTHHFTVYQKKRSRTSKNQSLPPRKGSRRMTKLPLQPSLSDEECSDQDMTIKVPFVPSLSRPLREFCITHR